MSLPVGAAAAPPDYVRIFDTTLRDGEQSPGASLTSDEKLEVARALSRLGVDVIEAGFPAASPDDLAARGGVPPGVVFFAKPVNYDELRGYLRACCAARTRRHPAA